VGGSQLAFASWEAAVKGDDLETTNFESYDATALQGPETYSEGIKGVLSCDLRFGGDWDAGDNPLNPPEPPGLYPRDDLETLVFNVSRVDAYVWEFPYARLRSATNGGEVKGKVSFQCSGMGQGPFSYPG